MTKSQIAVTLEDFEFTEGELREFLDTISSVDGMSANPLIEVSHHVGNGPTLYTLKASTAYRAKD